MARYYVISLYRPKISLKNEYPTLFLYVKRVASVKLLIWLFHMKQKKLKKL